MLYDTKAKSFAMLKHSNKVRKYTGNPYIEHCINVVNILLSLGYDNKELIQAAYLHDTVEDTNTSIEEIRKKFGDVVAEYVWFLTDYNDTEKEGNRETRKTITQWKITKAPTQAKLIKLADLIDNTKDIVLHDKKFAVQYLKEKRELLEVLKSDTCYGNFKLIEDLWFEAEQVLELAEKQLKESK